MQNVGCGVPLRNKELRPNKKLHDSKRAQAVLVDYEHHLTDSHFASAFTTKSVVIYFTVTLLDGLGDKITFPSDEKKVRKLSFKIQIIK